MKAKVPLFNWSQYRKGELRESPYESSKPKVFSLLRILSSNQDEYDRVWINAIFGIKNGSPEKIHFFMSKEVCKYLELALKNAMENKKFIRNYFKKELKGGENGEK